MPDGNFQDYVSLTQDTLQHKGAEFAIGTTTASTAQILFSNSAGALALAATATGNATAWLPSGGGTLLSAVNVSAGTTSQNLTNVVYSNSNGVSFGLSGSTITASVAAALSAINVSAGTTSLNLTALTLSNANGVSFGLNNSTLTAQVSGVIQIAAGTQTATSQVVFSNSNNVSFGMSTNAGGSATVTASFQINLSAGTTSQNLTAVTFSNSNGISFGLNGSTITAELAGFSSWSNGQVVTSFATSNAFLSLQPALFNYNITASNLIQLVSISGITNSSGGFTMSVVAYTISGGTAGSLSSASSATSGFTWTSGAAYSSSSGVNYLQMSLASWAFTPGPYVLGIAVASANSASLTFFGNQSGNTIQSGGGSFLTNQIFDGFSASSIAAIPTSVAISNTTAYVRTGTSVNNQPWILLQGT